jgi:succinate dehydrogenase/fumarate reductase flavoprotein subunit
MDNAELDDLAKDSMDDVLEGSTGDEFMKDAVRDVEWLLTRFFEVEKDAESILDFCCVKSPGKKGNNCVIGAKKALVGNVVCGQAVVCLSRLSKTGLLEIKSGCEVTKLLKQDGKVTGCGYTDVDGNDQEIMGAVVLATGGFGGDFATNSVMAKTKPQLLQLPTVNGEKVDGAGIVLAQEAGAGLTRLDEVNLYPLACSGPNIGDETDQFKFILSTLLLGGGGVILDADGNRFCDEKTTDPREISRLMMEKAKPPFYLVLSADELPDNVRWLCNFYLKNNVLNAHSSPGALAREMTVKHPQNRGPSSITVDAAKIEAIVGANRQCFSKIVCPAVYTCSGGVKVDKVTGAVTDKGGTAIPGLYAAGEVADGPSQTVSEPEDCPSSSLAVLY